mgnify:CR=1 FL=1
MYCVNGNGCDQTGSASIQFVESELEEEVVENTPERICNIPEWNKDTTHTGYRPNCPMVPIRNDGANYHWGKLAK